MPASSSDNICQIEETLKSSLGGGEVDLDSDISSSSKRILLTQIVFKPAEKPYSLQIDSLRRKYIPLNPSQKNKQNENGEHKKDIKMNGSGEGHDGLPVPKVVLYPEENVRLDWKKIQRIGAGLVNMGNTCFLNSTLQCLTYTAPLVNYCLGEEHNSTCKLVGFCMMCELQRHVKRCFDNYGNAIKPQSILQKLRMIAKHMHWGRQEDAHEFLRYLVDALQKSCLGNMNGLTKLDKFSKETTVVNQIFGGFLRSQVQCLKCKERSNTFDPLLDISLDIKNVQTLEKAFEKYVHPEMLDNENAYMCTKCKHKVPAQKRFSIHKPPNVLTVSLKRFDFHRMMGKISRHINFPERLNIRPYMSNRQGDPIIYNLYAVLVHSGVHCNSGHYYCFVKSPSQIWYCMNDSMVTQCSAQRVLSSEAYLLFYIKAKSLPNIQKQKVPLIGPVQPTNHIMKTVVNGLKVHQNNDFGSVIPRKTAPLVKPPSSATSTLSSSSSTFLSNLPGAAKPSASFTTKSATSTLLPANREKVAFGIKPKQPFKSQDGNKEEKPRIVMQIKNGKVTTYEKSPNGKAKIVNGGGNSTSKLVPYDGGSDSEEESKQSKTNISVDKVKVQMDKLNVESERKHSPKHKENVETEILHSFSPKHKREDNVNNESESRYSSLPKHKKEIETESRHSSSPRHKVVFDEKLNATTSVPGNANLLESASKDDRVNGVSKIKHLGQSPSSKLKDSTPDRKHTYENSNLTCITNTKINSTSNWHILNQDSILSPSRGSNSSKESTNSTTEWQIKEVKDIRPIPKLAEHQHPGWKVMEDNKEKLSNKPKVNGNNGISSQSEPNIYKNKDKDKIYKTIIDVKHDVQNHKPYSYESVDVSDKQNLNSPDSTEYTEKHKKHKKKKHRHQKDNDHQDVQYQELVNNSSTSETSHKKQKKKKHKHKKEREHDEDKKLKRHREDDKQYRNEDSHTKKRKEDSESDDSGELVWVEKTKDSLEKSKDVPVQSWDYHVKDGYKRQKNGFHDNTKPTWDGSKNSTVAANLVKSSSVHGYGSSVLSWDGEKSIVDREVEKDKERKRHWSDEYDDEIDTGKVKKVKNHYSDTDFHQSNVFQYVQSERNKDGSRHTHGSHSVGQSQSYHHHQSHSGHKGHHQRNHHHSYSKHDNKH